MRQPYQEKKFKILDRIRRLPKKMLELQACENVAEFLLCEIASNHFFCLAKAAYFVDNPDFDCIKGVTGVCKQEQYEPIDQIWEQREQFSEFMHQAPFNQTVRGFSRPSYVRAGVEDQAIVDAIAQELLFSEPAFYSWPVRHDNKGMLLYEKVETGDCDCDYLLDCLCLLGLCPVF